MNVHVTYKVKSEWIQAWSCPPPLKRIICISLKFQRVDCAQFCSKIIRATMPLLKNSIKEVLRTSLNSAHLDILIPPPYWTWVPIHSCSSHHTIMQPISEPYYVIEVPHSLWNLVVSIVQPSNNICLHSKGWVGNRGWSSFDGSPKNLRSDQVTVDDLEAEWRRPICACRRLELGKPKERNGVLCIQFLVELSGLEARLLADQTRALCKRCCGSDVRCWP
jgi:hypothetical protein